MEGDEVLNAVFRFKHKVPSDRQEAAVCNALVKLFAAFVASLEAVEVQEHKCGLVEPLADDRVVPASAFTVHEMEVLRQTSQRLTASGGTHKRGDVWYGPWLPKYGCVLQRQQKNAVDVTIQMDMLNGGEGLDTFCATLENISGKLEQTPRNFENVPLFSELAGFALQYSNDARRFVKTFAGMTRRWAEDARSEYKEESSPRRIAEIRRKECVLYGFALLAYSLGPWDDEAAQEVCELIVLFRTSFLCASINVSSTDQMLRTESKIAEVMSRRITELINYVKNNDIDTVLTALVRLVSATSPERLEWKQFRELSTDGEQFGSCFEAVDTRMDVHYSINLFTGIVLTDGYAPGERKYCGRLYDFALEEDDELFVQELEANCREVFFIATFEEGGSFQCYKVPFSDTKRPYEELLIHLDEYDQFVRKEESLLGLFKILTKFEEAKFLHPLRSPEGVLKIELPRLKLTLSLNSNLEFESVEHKGYILATNQQFDDFLPRFSRYLLLELQDKSDSVRPELRMLLPVGSVEESSDEMVDIIIPGKADSMVEVHCYDVHRRLKTFETETIVADDYVKSIEMKLKLFLQIEAGTTKDIPQLPLDTDTVNAMSKGMLDELQVSWKTYHSQAEPKLKAEPSVILGSFTALLSEVSSRRGEMETYLEDSFSKATSSTRDQLLALANYLPLLTVTDIVRCAFDEETLRTLAPKLSEESREQFKKAVLQYMELCVLEDKMERLIWKAKRSDDLSDAQLIDELMNVRQWQSTEFPYWLAFEVEGRLQIRHEQFVIAQHLINGPGTVCQLNMGRGKTRVILPMLFLHFTQSRCPRVVRAHFLSPLLSEARQFMHRYLSASSAHLGVFEQPFHRQIDLDARRLEFIRNNLDELKLFGGIQLVAPEHRMSLELKRLELGNEGPNVEALDEILDSDQFVDVLDECDALLHHNLDDARQFETLCKVYNFCMEAINFYLNTCVFPKDTQQYPQRLSRTAWNLAAGKNNIGFSGTNDNHRLLPLSVTQREPDEPSLLGTNGKMIDKILQVTHSYEVTRPSPESTSIPWQNVLFFAMDKKAQALIDTGALLAGVANHDAAKFLLERDDFGFAGVAYFDSREENNCWMIAEKARRIEVSLKKSSMLEKETFVIFDEARSRGSDMKLLPDAAAVLTLGPKLTKDKLMQGAGRMRQLGCNQSLWITSFDEVAQSILQISSLRELSSVSPIDVLNWVMDNTKTEA
ncbi:hypothetical protein JG687_00001494, partial [Phytophthora cactorum]